MITFRLTLQQGEINLTGRTFLIGSPGEQQKNGLNKLNSVQKGTY